MTKKYLLLFTLIMALLPFASCKRIVGSGPVQTEVRTVAPFTKVSLDMDADIIIKQDSIYKLEVAAQSNLLPVILTNVNGSTLTVKHKNNTIISSGKITVYISLPVLEEVSVSGSGKVYAQNKMTAGNLSFDITGSGAITMTDVVANSIDCDISGSGDMAIIQGSAQSLDTHISGSGKIDCINMPCNTVSTHTTGSGTTKVYAVQSLSAKISGSGNVYYKGNPSVHTEISGSGKLIKQ